LFRKGKKLPRHFFDLYPSAAEPQWIAGVLDYWIDGLALDINTPGIHYSNIPSIPSHSLQKNAKDEKK